MLKQISVLGATGSIGKSTLDVLAKHKDDYALFAVSAHTQMDSLLDICNEWNPQYAVVSHVPSAERFAKKLSELKNNRTQLLVGEQGLIDIAENPQVDIVMAAIVGAAGLSSSLAAAQAGKRVLLANKESLVMAGDLFMRAVKENHASLLPVDSEHNAIFQCLDSQYVCGEPLKHIRKILLTASGGPFRSHSLAELEQVTPAQACAHPNWDMGRKISVDSATMMNKGLELIEACYLFDCLPKDINVVIHPQSIVHSMVEYVDGSVLAQMGLPDMRTPIAHALAWPKRIESGVGSLDVFSMPELNFTAPDYALFPCLKLAIDAAYAGQSAMIALNAANEVAVESFLQEKIKFTQIADVIAQAMQQHAIDFKVTELFDLDVIKEQDAHARHLACQAIDALLAA